MNITLIGMPGSGKSHIGKLLSEHLEYELVELDRILEEMYNMPLQSVLDTLGDKEFLEAQERDAITYTEGRDRMIISPGGSIVYTENAMRHLKNVSTIVYLEADIATIMGRIQEVPRGIVGLKNKTFEELYSERCVLYELWASHTVRNMGSEEETVRDIVSALQGGGSL